MGHDPRRKITIIVWSSIGAAPDGRAPAVEMAKAISGHSYRGKK
jgi:D-alanyl-D-alanine carboxypeptidase